MDQYSAHTDQEERSCPGVTTGDATRFYEGIDSIINSCIFGVVVRSWQILREKGEWHVQK